MGESIRKKKAVLLILSREHCRSIGRGRIAGPPEIVGWVLVEPLGLYPVAMGNHRKLLSKGVADYMMTQPWSHRSAS